MEIIVLIGVACLIFLSAAVQHAGTVIMRGVGFVISDRSDPMPETGFSGRARRTLQNNLESAAMMLPLVVVLLVTGTGNLTTQAAGGVYLLARFGFSLAYWLGISTVRSVSWAIGMAAIAVTFASVLSKVPVYPSAGS